ncbi:MAG: pyruvate ferredoxin oxidoreductase [Deltaproteobacteria bacterium]|nr:pyruvate ferredoxin oxidoreductase [Deltaproteobacteria bacterium]MBW1953594.1 pyruvate ferredoxin oxidoreductase [Deltaproteobacteria bacterium]MBW2135260.1 pyruvate ferredoxin oxidoreductase [Deltaproteobacteria bacterium]
MDKFDVASSQKYDVYASRLLPKEEYFTSGHRSCQGCGEALAVRWVCKAIGKNAVIAHATGCMEIVSSGFPQTAWVQPWIHVAFENTAAVASGLEAGYKILARKGKLAGHPPKVVAMGGDGGTSDIGLQALSGAMERGHDFTYICWDNEAYMNTGIQRSSSTPYGAMTTTSPPGKRSIGQPTWKKNMVAIAVAHGIPYVATACPSYLFDLYFKVKRAVETPGPAYIHILSVCPTGWRSATDLTVRLGRLAVETGVFPLYEVVDGRYRLTIEIPKLRPVKDYLRLQGRFRHLREPEIEFIQRQVLAHYDLLLKKCAAPYPEFPPLSHAEEGA